MAVAKVALELSGTGEVIPGLIPPPAAPPPKKGDVVVGVGTFGLINGGVVIGIFVPPAVLDEVGYTQDP